MSRTRWKLHDTLRHHGKTSSDLVRASGLTKSTVHGIVNGKSKVVKLETLDKLLDGLEKLTGERMDYGALFERQEDAHPDPALQAQVAALPSFDWNKVQKLIPSWTDEERAEHEAFVPEMECVRREDRVLDERRTERLLGLFVDTGAEEPQP